MGCMYPHTDVRHPEFRICLTPREKSFGLSFNTCVLTISKRIPVTSFILQDFVNKLLKETSI